MKAIDIITGFGVGLSCSLKQANENKLNEVIDKYFNETPNYPRKKKKRVRKELTEDYRFWKSVQHWQDKSLL